MSKIRRSGPWSPKEVREFLDASAIPMRLAANTTSGFPVVLSLWFLRDGDDLLAAVHRDSKIVKRLRADGRCAFEIASNDPPYLGVRGQANAELLHEGAGGLLERLLVRYLGTKDSTLGRFLLSRSDEELTVRLRPRSIASWDYTQRMEDSGTAQVADIEVITHSDHIEALLAPYKEAIGDDFEGYRGHVYRVLSYALYFLGGHSPHRREIEAALVYHDLGLWSDRQIAYLEPSIERAQADNVANQWNYEPKLMRDIIFWHHKVTPFRGPNEDIVNAVRKADWIDASGGLVRQGMSKANIDKVTSAIPNAGFYDTLKRIGPELTGSFLKSIGGLLKVYKL